MKKKIENDKTPQAKASSTPQSSPAPAASPARRPAARKPANAAPKNYVVIDYPLEGEILSSAEYTFRIGTSASERVEVSVDGREWQACREHSGYWWFDWSNYSDGPHQLEARIPSGKRFLKSQVRHFTVLF